LVVPPRKASARAVHPGGKSRKHVVRASFGLGFACGGLLGAAALLVLTVVHHEPARLPLGRALPEASASLAASWPVQPVDASAHAAAAAPPIPSLDMTLRRSDAGAALFPLAITGADSADGVRVVLRDLPETAWLSRGERQDEHTWALRLADLEDLHVTLGEGTPEAFDVVVEVVSAPGAPLARTVAHVRLADRRQTVVTPERRSSAAAIANLLSAAAAAPAGVATPFRTEVQEAMPRAEEPAPAALLRPPLPQGLSSLGGPMGAPAPPETSRKVWWTVPTPAWSPFADGASGN
jgi:hypothetical protein